MARLRRFLWKALTFLPLLLAPFWFFWIVPVLWALPWWLSLGVCYFFASQSVDQIKDYEVSRLQANAALLAVPQTPLPISDFLRYEHISGESEVSLVVKQSEGLRELELVGEKYLTYFVIPVTGEDSDLIRAGLVVARSKAETLREQVLRRSDGYDTFVVRGEIDPSTPYFSPSLVKKALNEQGVEFSEDLFLIEPFWDGRAVWRQDQIKRTWWSIMVTLSLAAIFFVTGLLKLRFWLWPAVRF